MIEIQGIGFYDETKSFNEQDEPVNIYLQEIASTFNDMTAISVAAKNALIRIRIN